MRSILQPLIPDRVYMRYQVLEDLYGLPTSLRLRIETEIDRIRRGKAVFLPSHRASSLYYVDFARIQETTTSGGIPAIPGATLSILMSDDGKRVEVTGLV